MKMIIKRELLKMRKTLNHNNNNNIMKKSVV